MSAIPYEITYNSLTIDESTEGFTVFGIEGIDGLEVRTAADALTGLDGGNVWNQLYDMRSISIEGVIRGTDAADYFTKKSQLVSAYSIKATDKTLTLKMINGVTRTISGYVISTPKFKETAGKLNYGIFQIQMLCPFIYFLDSVSTTNTLILAQVEGFDIPFDIPFDIEGGTGNTVNINNTGDAIAYPIYTFKNQAVSLQNPTITNQTTGDSFQINDTLVTGDQVIVRFNNNGLTVTKNGVNALPTFLGEYVSLALDNNSLAFTASNYDSGAQCEITYSFNYLSF